MELVRVVFPLLFILQLASALHCRVSDQIPWEDPNNLYTCKDEQTCCTEDAKPTCCSAMEEQEAIMRQVKLWCGVLGAITVFGLIVWYARWDGQFCDEDTTCYACCCACCSKKIPKQAGKQRKENMFNNTGFSAVNPGKFGSERDLITYENEA